MKILKNLRVIALCFISDILKNRDFPIFHNVLWFVFTFKMQIKLHLQIRYIDPQLLIQYLNNSDCREYLKFEN